MVAGSIVSLHATNRVDLRRRCRCTETDRSIDCHAGSHGRFKSGRVARATLDNLSTCPQRLTFEILLRRKVVLVEVRDSSKEI